MGDITGKRFNRITSELTGITGLYTNAILQATKEAFRNDVTATLWILGNKTQEVCKIVGFDHKMIARTVGRKLLGRGQNA